MEGDKAMLLETEVCRSLFQPLLKVSEDTLSHALVLQKNSIFKGGLTPDTLNAHA